jgi:hypothetical protein
MHCRRLTRFSPKCRLTVYIYLERLERVITNLFYLELIRGNRLLGRSDLGEDIREMAGQRPGGVLMHIGS